MKTRRSSIYFFGCIFLTMLFIPLMMLIPNFWMWQYLPYWWVVLLPVIILKMMHVIGLKTKLFNWLNTSIKIKL